MSYLPGLIIALAALWFALSGETAPMFVALGAASVVFTLWFAARLGIIGRDASPYHRLIRLLVYLVWLLFEIVKANIAVIGKVLSPRRAIDPELVRLKVSPRSDLGRALFANSITLTPGTCTIDVDGDLIVVHALTRENATPSNFERMNYPAAKTGDPSSKPKKA